MAVLLPALLQLLLAVNPDKNLATTVLVQLTGSVAVALVGGLWPAILAALWSSLLVNYFSTPPVGTLTISDSQNVLALLVFVGVSAAVATVVDLSARRSKEAALARAEAATLADLSRGAAGSEDTIAGLLEQALDVFQVRGAALLSCTDDDAFRAGAGAGAGARAGGWRLVASAGEVPASVPAPGRAPAPQASTATTWNGSTPPRAWSCPAGCCRPATGACSAPLVSIWRPSWNASNCWPADPKS